MIRLVIKVVTLLAVVRIWEEEETQKAELQYQWGSQLKSREIESFCWGDKQEEVGYPLVLENSGLIQSTGHCSAEGWVD